MTENYTREIRDGREVLLYPDGTIKDAATGHFLAPPTSAKITTSEQGRAMVLRRKELAEQRARDAMDAAAIEAGKMDLNKQGSGEGWYAIVKHTALTFLKSSNLRGMAEIFAKLGQAGGYVSTQKVEVEGTVTHEVSEAAAQLIEFINDEVKRRDDAAEGEIIDDTPGTTPSA